MIKQIGIQRNDIIIEYFMSSKLNHSLYFLFTKAKRNSVEKSYPIFEPLCYDFEFGIRTSCFNFLTESQDEDYTINNKSNS